MVHPEGREGRRRAGVAYLLAATVALAVMAATAKHLGETLGGWTPIWGRYFFALALIVCLWPARLPAAARAGRSPVQFVRSAMMFTATFCHFQAITRLQLIEVTAIGFLAPLGLAAIGVFFLGERASARRWAAIALGFVGAFVVVFPKLGGGGATAASALGVLFALGFASAYALYQATTRIARAASVHESLFWTNAVGALITSAAAPFLWTPPTLGQWALLVLLGASATLAHFLMIKAFQRAEASGLAPFQYVNLLWSTLTGFVLFGDTPSAWAAVGGGAIALAGLMALAGPRNRSGDQR